MRKLLIILACSGVLFGQVPLPSPNAGGGGGTVTSIATGCGLTGGTITKTGTIAENIVTAAHNGSYAILTATCGTALTTNTAAAWTIAQAGSAGFLAGWFVDINNVGSGSLTVTATTSTFYGGPTANISGSVLTVPANTSARIISDGTNYQVLSGGGSGGGGNTTIANGSASATAATAPGVPAPTTYGAGTTVSPYLSGTFIPGMTTTGAPFTLNIAGLGAKNVFVNGVATSATNTVTVGIPYSFQYDGTQIQVISGGGTTPISLSQGTWANKPATCNSTANFWYLFLDAIYNDETCFTGASTPTYRFGGRAVTPPVLANFTSVASSGTVTTDITHGGIALKLAASSSQRSEVAYPSTPFTQGMGIKCNLLTNTTSSTVCGIYNRNASTCYDFDYLGNFRQGYGVGALTVVQRTGPTCTGGSVLTSLDSDFIPVGVPALYLYISDDGATVNFWYSIDGIIATQFYTVSSLASSAAIGFITNTDSTFPANVGIFHWGTCNAANTFVC